jgi:phosphatidylserine/phosphatidylglycerophosphate/cardiolipin synthase-like enzyme
MKPPLGLSRIPLPMLEELAASVEHARIDCPLTEAGLIDSGWRGRTRDVVEALGQADKLGVLAAIRVTIAERVHRAPPRLDLVWTGPETKASVARSTGLVVEQLFKSAKNNVIVGGYTFDRAQILEPLYRAMKDRGVTVMVFVDIEGATPNRGDADAFAGAVIDKWMRKVWTFGAPKPEIYYDPRTAIQNENGHDWATLHAKCIVVDDERSLITSANFTDRGQTRNIESGVLIDDKAFAEDLASHWRQLVSEGLVRKYLG